MKHKWLLGQTQNKLMKLLSKIRMPFPLKVRKADSEFERLRKEYYSADLFVHVVVTEHCIMQIEDSDDIYLSEFEDVFPSEGIRRLHAYGIDTAHMLTRLTSKQITRVSGEKMRCVLRLMEEVIKEFNEP